MLKSDEYNTIKDISEGFFKEKGSKFFAFAYHVTSEEQINEFRQALRKKHHDARHHVFAYRLGAEKNIFRSSDDGEPANSSGPPILGQIKSHDLTDILIVVIRYFGGTKLGIPGLINAYKTAANDAITNSKVITKIQKKAINIKFEYPQMNNVMRIIKEESLAIVNQKLELSCEITVDVRISEYDKVLERFRLFHELKIDS